MEWGGQGKRHKVLVVHYAFKNLKYVRVAEIKSYTIDALFPTFPDIIRKSNRCGTDSDQKAQCARYRLSAEGRMTAEL